MIRKMQLDDLTQVAALEQSLFGDPWSEKAFRDTLEQEEADFIVAVNAQNEIIGYCGAYRALDEAEIVNVAIKKEHQNHGYGAEMVQALIEEERKTVLFPLSLRCGQAIYRRIVATKNWDLEPLVSAGIFMIARRKMHWL